MKITLSNHCRTLLDEFKERSDKKRLGHTEAVHALVEHYYLEEPTSILEVRHMIKKRVARGIDKSYLLELTLLHSYLEHLLLIYS